MEKETRVTYTEIYNGTTKLNGIFKDLDDWCGNSVNLMNIG